MSCGRGEAVFRMLRRDSTAPPRRASTSRCSALSAYSSTTFKKFKEISRSHSTAPRQNLLLLGAQRPPLSADMLNSCPYEPQLEDPNTRAALPLLDRRARVEFLLEQNFSP